MNFIDKSTFNKLSVNDQIKLFNSLLKEHNNIKEVCDIIGISYSTIRDRFHKNNYYFNKFIQQYELISKKNKNEELEQIIKGVVNEINRKSIEPLEYKKDKIVVRSFRVYEDVLKNFMEFCENSSLKQYDVISLFLMEGINKYKKI